MYDKEIKVANKILSFDDLMDIFARMQERLIYYQKIYKSEELKNKVLDYRYQEWTFKDTGSSLKFNINFYDNTEIKFDNYTNFITVFQNRLDEIKNIYVSFRLNYDTRRPNSSTQYYNQYITLWIYEYKMDITLNLSSEDKKIDDVYELIQNKILNAPIKYDETIKKKSTIISTVGFAIGFIPGIILCILLLFVPSLRVIFSASYVLFPILSLIISYAIGSTCCTGKIEGLYKPLVPDKKYISYEKGYKDDIDKYIETSEILIGKNIDNLKNRKEIMNDYNKYKKYIPYEIGVLILLSIIVIFLK